MKVGGFGEKIPFMENFFKKSFEMLGQIDIGALFC
jgi:hypothetical protein